MLCTTPVKRGETYDLSLRMPRDAKNEDLAFFEVISIWTCPSPRPDSCLSGFRLLNYWQNTESHLALSSAVNDYELFLSACVADSSAEELVT